MIPSNKSSGPSGADDDGTAGWGREAPGRLPGHVRVTHQNIDTGNRKWPERPSREAEMKTLAHRPGTGRPHDEEAGAHPHARPARHHSSALNMALVIAIVSLLLMVVWTVAVRTAYLYKPPAALPTNFSRTLLGTFLIGATSAMIAEFFTFPFDTLKTRMHLFQARVDRIPARPAQGLLHQIKSLYHGVGIACFRQLPYSGTRQMLFQCTKFFLTATGILAATGSPLLTLAIVAGFAGAAGQIVANWTDVLKVRMQSDGRKILMGQEPEYKNIFDAFNRLWKEEGVAGFMVGTVPNTVRAVLINFADIGIYDTVKEAAAPMYGAGLGSAALASAVCGLASAIVACPAEVSRNRMMNNGPTAPVVMYHSLSDCVLKTYKEGGVKAFFQGLLPFYARNGPWHLIFWICFEHISSHLDGVIPPS